MLTLAEFIERMAIRMTCEEWPTNPNMEGADQMDNWRCVLRHRNHGRKAMTVYFSMGVGLNGREPSAAEVLSSLASDAAGIQNARSFEDWCGEYGYDTDSRKAERIFKVCEREADKLRRFLGSSAAYETLLFGTERE